MSTQVTLDAIQILGQICVLVGCIVILSDVLQATLFSNETEVACYITWVFFVIFLVVKQFTKYDYLLWVLIPRSYKQDFIDN